MRILEGAWVAKPGSFHLLRTRGLRGAICRGDKNVIACFCLFTYALHHTACLQCIRLLPFGNRKRLQASGSTACALGNLYPGLGAQQLSPCCDTLQAFCGVLLHPDTSQVQLCGPFKHGLP